ncbi:MAG: hypothetical protein JWN78_74 [Bacteroidota bacterium]|nr:hypothetical protein [Bacteroidota bacterium]
MNKRFYLFPLLIFSFFASLAQPKIKLDTFARPFPAPIDIENDGTTPRVFIVCQTGLIFVYDSNGVKLDTFADLRSKVQSSGEEGLLGFAFHPNYASNGYFYTYYTKKNTTDNYVYRYKVSANPNRATTDSEMLVITILHPTNTNHNGGCLKFGNDGYLYISTGDGGGGGDVPNNAQNKNILLGKILRLDVNRFDTAYRIPPTNPLVAQTSVRKEIWAYGLRNPWRFTFDRLTHDLWIGDVGQSAMEEIDFQAANSSGGENYGWRCYEGTNTYNTAGCLSASNYKFPVFAYDRSASGGTTVTGGVVYRGNKYADLYGYYIFTDYGSNNFWVIKKVDTIFTVTPLGVVLTNSKIASFGEDIRGELYAANVNTGTIYKIRELCSNFKVNIANFTNPSCPNVLNGFIQASATGNNGLVTYNWSNSGSGSNIPNLGPGKYVVTGTDAAGCVKKDSVVLYNLDTLRIRLLNIQYPSCPNVSNGSIEVEGIHGNGNYNYNWSNLQTDAQINNLSDGKYVVTVHDGNNCTAKDSFVLYNQDTLRIHLVSLQNPSCPNVSNGSIVLTGTHGNGNYQYNWSNGDTTFQNTNLSDGKYIVVVNDGNNCTATDSFVLYNQDTLDKPIITQSGNFLQTDTGFSYVWKLNGNITGGSLDTIHPSATGSYTVEITDVNGCKATSDPFAFVFTGIKIKSADIDKFSLYPNPVNENLMIDIVFHSAKKSTLRITNTIGQIVYEEKLLGKEISKNISVKQLPKGVYEMSLYTEDGKVETKTFMKE